MKTPIGKKHRLLTVSAALMAMTAATFGQGITIRTANLPTAVSLPTGSELIHSFDTAVRSAPSDHNFVSTNSILMSEGHHLVIYNSRFDSASGVDRSEIQTNLNLGGLDLAEGWSSGYMRRLSGQNEAITAGGAIIHVDGPGKLLQLQSFRSDNNSPAAVVRATANTGIQLLKLDDGWDYLRVSGGDVNQTQTLPQDTTTWLPVVYNVEMEKDSGSFSFTPSTADITLGRPGHYLVFANTYLHNNSAASDREMIIQRLTLDGAEVVGSRTSAYLRGRSLNGSFRGKTSLGMIIEAASPGQVLNVQVQQDIGVFGAILGNRTALTIVKLPDTADFIRLTDTSGDQNLNSTRTLLYNDTGSQLELDSSFSHSPFSLPGRIGVNVSGDYLFLAAQYDDDDGVERGYYNQGWQRNGTTGYFAYGQTGQYSRNSQNDAFGNVAGLDKFGNWSGFITELNVSGFVETLTRPLGGTGTNTADTLALQGVRISDLFASGANDPPTIFTNPSNVTICVGGSAEFNVVATGQGNLIYQWFKNNTPIAGANQTSYRINAVGFADAGSYHATVTNEIGTVTSSIAILNVPGTGPEITQHPLDQEACPGHDVTFTVVSHPHIGGTMHYQWRKDGQILAAETNPILSLTAVDADDAGFYDCIVTEDGCGSTTSNAAQLLVGDFFPVITINGQTQMFIEACLGSYTELGAVAIDGCDGPLPVTTRYYVAGQETAGIDPEVPGEYSVVYSAADHVGQLSVAVRQVSVRDTINPQFTFVPGNLSLNCGPGNQADIDAWLALVAATDACGVQSIVPQLNWYGTCGLSHATATWTVTDVNGRTSSVSRTVFVTPDGTLHDISFAEPSLDLVLEANGVFNLSVPILNAGNCPSVISSAQISAGFSSPAISIVSTSFPLTACPGSAQAIGLRINTVGALEGTYNATLTITGLASGSVSQPIRIVISGELLPDLSATFTGGGVDVIPYSSPVFPVSGEGFAIRAQIKNVGPTASTPFTVKFFEGNNLMGTTSVAALGIGQIATTNLQVPDGLIDGFYLIRAEIVPPAEGELSLENNVGGAILQVGTPPITNAEVLLYGSVTPNCGLRTGTLSVRAEYELTSVTTIEDAEGNTREVVSKSRFPMQGARVDALIAGTSFGVNGAHTDVNGRFVTTVGLPAAGTYQVDFSVTDFTVTGEEVSVLVVPEVDPCFVGGAPSAPGTPDPIYPVNNVDLYVCSDDIHFLDTNGTAEIPMPALPGSRIKVAAEVHYYTSLGLPLENQRVVFTARRQFGGIIEEIPIGTALVSFSGGGVVEAMVPWIVPANGTYSVLVTVDPDATQPTRNDEATRAIISGTPPAPDTYLRVDAAGSGCSYQLISGRATYASDGTASLPDICGDVTVRAYGPNNSLIGTVGGIHTDSSGSFYFGTYFSLPVGMNRLVVSVTDGTLTGTDEIFIECLPPNRPAPNTPPESRGDLYVFAEHIGFLEQDGITALRRSPLPDETISIVTDLQYWDNNEQQPLADVPVRISVLVPNSDGGFDQEVVDTVLQDFQFSGGSYIASVPWTPTELGPQIVQVYIDPDDTAVLPFNEYRGNNAATKLIYIGEIDCILTADPEAKEVIIGESAQYVITGETLGDRNPTLAMKLLADTPNLPPGVSFSFTQPNLTLPAQTTLTINTTPQTPRGTYFFNVVGSGDGCEAIARIQLDVIGDITPPVLTLVGANPFVLECGDQFVDPGASAADDFDGNVTSKIVVNGQIDNHSLGNQVLTYTVADLFGNVATASRTVTVRDTTPPVITLNGDASVILECGVDSYHELGARALDHCDPNVVVVIGGDAVDAHTPGTYIVTYQATDASGNHATEVVRTVVARDTTPPVITLNGDASMVLECAIDSYTEPGAVVLDYCDPHVVVEIRGDAGDGHTLGTYLITYSAIDASGNRAVEVTRTVVMRDTTSPVITLNGEAIMTLECGIDSYTDPGASVVDQCAVGVVAVVGGDTVDDFKPGTYVVIYSATDASGNRAVPVTRRVIVQDTTPPRMVRPEPVTLASDSDCSGVVPDFIGGLVVSDNCSPRPNITVVQNPAPGAVVGLGSHAIVLTATDAHGNSAQSTTAFFVEDETPPVISNPQPVSVNANSQCVGIVPDLTTEVVATDCNGPVSLEQVPAAGSEVELGSHSVTITATDKAGNSSSRQVALTVVDVTPPVVTIVAPTSGLLSPVGTPVTFSGTFVDCNESGPFTSEWIIKSPTSQEMRYAGNLSDLAVNDSFIFSAPGVYSIRLRVTDPAGNSAEASTVLNDLPAYIVVFDPNGGFVTGGGWIWSPPGSLHPGLANYVNVQGKSTFGFVSKYKKGANVPEGQTEFQFHAGNLNFHSISYEWLVVAGDRAQFKGDGKVNGVSGFKFILSAIDGRITGPDRPDRFRIKIWDAATGVVMYDNQSYSDDNADLDDLTVLRGGNIVIHK